MWYVKNDLDVNCQIIETKNLQFSNIQKSQFQPWLPSFDYSALYLYKAVVFSKKLASKKAEKNGLTSLELAAAFIQIVRAHRAPLGRLKLQSL